MSQPIITFEVLKDIMNTLDKIHKRISVYQQQQHEVKIAALQERLDAMEMIYTLMLCYGQACMETGKTHQVEQNNAVFLRNLINNTYLQEVKNNINADNTMFFDSVQQACNTLNSKAMNLDILFRSSGVVYAKTFIYEYVDMLQICAHHLRPDKTFICRKTDEQYKWNSQKEKLNQSYEQLLPKLKMLRRETKL